jgi:hypothetical protein
VAFVSCALVLNLRFALNIVLVVMLVVVAGLIQNIIATRAAAQTNFNPARVMGILLQGVTAAVRRQVGIAINLTGAGFVSGSGAQASLLTATWSTAARSRCPRAGSSGPRPHRRALRDRVGLHVRLDPLGQGALREHALAGGAHLGRERQHLRQGLRRAARGR